MDEFYVKKIIPLSARIYQCLIVSVFFLQHYQLSGAISHSKAKGLRFTLLPENQKLLASEDGAAIFGKHAKIIVDSSCTE